MYRGINDFKKGYQPRTNTVKGVECNLVADSYSIVARWRKYFSQLLNVFGVVDVRHTEIYTAETLVPGPSAFDFELNKEKPIFHKSPGID